MCSHIDRTYKTWVWRKAGSSKWNISLCKYVAMCQLEHTSIQTNLYSHKTKPFNHVLNRAKTFAWQHLFIREQGTTNQGDPNEIGTSNLTFSFLQTSPASAPHHGNFGTLCYFAFLNLKCRHRNLGLGRGRRWSYVLVIVLRAEMNHFIIQSMHVSAINMKALHQWLAKPCLDQHYLQTCWHILKVFPSPTEPKTLGWGPENLSHSSDAGKFDN